MKVSNLEYGNSDGAARVSATVIWEDCDRPQKKIFVETSAEFADAISPDPNAFLLATIMPALRHCERRVQVEGKLCPKLRNGLEFAIQQILQWQGKPLKPWVDIEATEGFYSPPEPAAARTASFLSGGVDALSMLKTNRDDFPPDHPGSIRDCFFVHGIDVGGYESMDSNEDNSRAAIEALGRLAAIEKFSLIPVKTNIRHLDDDDAFFYLAFYGSVIAAIAHCFSRRISTAMVAAGSSVKDLGPIGSHPLLDPNYGSYWLRIEHDGVRFERIDKVAILSTWDDGLRSLRSCFNPFRDPSALNCGHCEKCIRTMTELLIHGALERAPTYPLDDINPALVESIYTEFPRVHADTSRAELIDIATRLLGPANAYYWEEMIEPLRSIGRPDLAQSAERLVRRYRQDAKSSPTRLRSIVGKLDSRYLGGRVRQVYRAFKNV